MNIVDFFNSGEVELPKSRGNPDFEGCVESILGTYQSLIPQVTGRDSVSQGILAAQADISVLCDSILESIGRYFDGFPHDAYKCLRTGITHVRPHLDHLGSRPDVSEWLQHLYRIHLGTMAGYSKGDLFHIPFDKRHLVSTQRYSIPGLPCLYLGGSLWVCWQELGRPEFHRIQMAQFKAVGAVRLLNFGYRPALLAAMIDANPEVLQGNQASDFAVSYAVCWPLIAASAIKVMNPCSPFVPEYIIPQQVLQWVVKESDYDGLRFFSAKVAQYVDNPATVVNYVFPVKKKASTGYCEALRQMFTMTEPSAWSVIQQADLPSTCSPNSTCRIEISPGVTVLYAETDFGKIEDKLVPFPVREFRGRCPIHAARL